MSINDKIDWEALKKEKKVIIPDGVKIIPSKSFMGSEIVSIEIPTSVEQIEPEAFLEC